MIAYYKLILTGIIALSLYACGSGGGGNTSNNNETDNNPQEIVLTGEFIDSPVAGLNYKTPSRSGKTNRKGEFKYLAGETISFSIGNINLGSAIGSPIMTPLTLVADTNDPTDLRVNNIVRLLLTLDSNNQPNDGIEISAEVDTAATDLSINFSSPNLSIEPGLQQLLTSLAVQPVLVDSSTAQTHFNASLAAQSSWGSMVWGKGSYQNKNFLSSQNTDR